VNTGANDLQGGLACRGDWWAPAPQPRP